MLNNTGFSRVRRNAKTTAKSDVFPKVIFKADNVESFVIIRTAADYSKIPDDSYLLAEPLEEGWGNGYDLLVGKTDKGSYVISYEKATTVPVVPSTCNMPAITFHPFETSTGSHMDYKFRYDGVFAPGINPVETEITPYAGYTHNESWYSCVPFPDGQIGFGNAGVLLDPTGAVLFNTNTVVPYSDGITAVVTPAGMLMAGNDNNNLVITRVKPDGTYQRDSVAPASLPAPVAPYTTTECFFSEEVIAKPDGSFYVPETRVDYYMDKVDYGGTLYDVKTQSPRKTISFKYVGDTLTYVGEIKGTPADASDPIATGGMTSMLNWRHIPGVNEMYFASYSTLARIDCTTDTVVWWKERPNDNDELMWVLPNKNVILPTMNDDYEYCISEFSYETGEILRTVVINPDYTGVVTDGSVTSWSNNILGMTGNNSCELYLAIENDAGSQMHYPMIMVIDLNTFTIKRQVRFLGDGPLDAGMKYQEPYYYGYNIIDAEGNWWFWYHQYGKPEGQMFNNEYIKGFACFDGTDIHYYPLTVKPSEYEGFFMSGNGIYYPTSTAIRRLTFGGPAT